LCYRRMWDERFAQLEAYLAERQDQEKDRRR